MQVCNTIVSNISPNLCFWCLCKLRDHLVLQHPSWTHYVAHRTAQDLKKYLNTAPIIASSRSPWVYTGFVHPLMFCFCVPLPSGSNIDKKRSIACHLPPRAMVFSSKGEQLFYMLRFRVHVFSLFGQLRALISNRFIFWHQSVNNNWWLYSVNWWHYSAN